MARAGPRSLESREVPPTSAITPNFSSGMLQMQSALIKRISQASASSTAKTQRPAVHGAYNRHLHGFQAIQVLLKSINQRPQTGAAGAGLSQACADFSAEGVKIDTGRKDFSFTPENDGPDLGIRLPGVPPFRISRSTYRQ